MTAQSKPAKSHHTTSDPVPTAHTEFLAALEQAIEATRRVQPAPPLVPSEHSAKPSDWPARPEPRAASSGDAPPDPRRDHDARQEAFARPPVDHRRPGGPSTSFPLQVRVPIRSPQPRVVGQRRPLDRISGAVRPATGEQQRQREAVLEQLRQRLTKPEDFTRPAKPEDLTQPKPRHWLGIAVLTRLAIVGAIALAVGFATYELISSGSPWIRLFGSTGDPAQFTPDRPSIPTDLSSAANPATPPEPVMPKPVKTATITAEADASSAWPSPQIAPSNPTPASVIDVPPAADAAPSTSAATAVENAATGTSRHLDGDEIAKLLKRSELFLNNGDIASARLLLRRAAEAGDARAALALAATYDPLVLKQLRAVGAKDDVIQARVWYERAAQLGSAEAGSRLQQLAGQVR